MRTLTVVALVAMVGLAAATVDLVPHTVADKDFLSHQKKLLEFIWHANQPIFDPEKIAIAKSFELEENIEHFENAEVVKRVHHLFNHGFFKKRGETFTPYNKLDRLQAQALVDLLYSAKDFDTFYKTAVTARYHLNEVLFGYAFGIAVVHREDTRHLVLPSLYEIYPQLFVKYDVLKHAYEAYVQGLLIDKEKPYIIHVNYSGYPYAHDAEELVSYFTEDIGLAAYYNYMQLRYPFWLKLENYGQEKYHRRGDHFYFGLKHLLARYNLERQSNHLPDVEAIDYRRPIRVGRNEEIIPNKMLAEIAGAFERRLYDAIDYGYVFDANLTKYSLREPENIELFGSIVEGNADSVNKDFYGSLFRILLAIAAHGDHPGDFDHPVSTLRHPLFYRIVKRVVDVFDYFKKHLGPYNLHQLEFPGVKVESVVVDKLVTYFEHYDFEMNTALLIPNAEVGSKLNLLGRTHRLTHKPFNYQIKVTSDKDVDAFVRVFYGPRYDVYGKELNLNEARNKFVYLDSFLYKLKAGENLLERNSKSFTYYGNQPLSFSKLYEKTLTALNGNEEVHIDDFVYKHGDVDRLALPKGTYSGLPLRFYVIVKPFTHTTISKTNPYTDDIGAKVSFFPFDRPINEYEFHVPNSAFTDVTVFHRDNEEFTAA